MYKGKITVKSATWAHEDRVKIRYSDCAGTFNFDRTTVIRTIEGDCTVEIDVDAIAAEVAKRALHSKNGSASGMHGKIKVRRIGAVRVVAEERKPSQLPRNASIVEENLM